MARPGVLRSHRPVGRETSTSRRHRPGIGLVDIERKRCPVLCIRFLPTLLKGEQMAEYPTVAGIIWIERDSALPGNLVYRLFDISA
jgi:hypothetical protein